MPENLPELRDIHLPDGVSAFPPAYGWWVILAAVAGAAVLYRLIAFLYRKSKKRYALRLLASAAGTNTLKSAAAMSEILRRICVYKYPSAAVLKGSEWIEFLNDRSNKNVLDARTAGLLLNAPYMPDTENGYAPRDVAALRDFCRRWIGENL